MSSVPSTFSCYGVLKSIEGCIWPPTMEGDIHLNVEQGRRVQVKSRVLVTYLWLQNVMVPVLHGQWLVPVLLEKMLVVVVVVVVSWLVCGYDRWSFVVMMGGRCGRFCGRLWLCVVVSCGRFCCCLCVLRPRRGDSLMV